MVVQITPKIINLKQYDLVFSTSWEVVFGISGHVYEMIDYYLVCKNSGINCAILLTDTTTKQVFGDALVTKYDFTDDEVTEMLANTYEAPRPTILMTKNLCIVDGSWRWRGATVYAENLFLLRCSEPDYQPLLQNRKTIGRIHLLQDFKLYQDRFEDCDMLVVDYTKKVLWNRYRKPKPRINNDTAMFYLTTAMRAIPVSEVQRVMEKHKHNHYLIITNDPEKYRQLESTTVSIELAPVDDIFSKFDTYIYTSVAYKRDCSPRFVVECAAFGKPVVYEVDEMYSGLKRRHEDLERGVDTLLLKDNDYFVEYVAGYVK